MRKLRDICIKALLSESPPIFDWRALRALSSELNIPAWELEARTLEMGFIPSRYERSIGTIGVDGQITLLRSKACVIGCGGLGGLICELLARSGIGRIMAVDGDIFTDNNLNRQTLCFEADVDKPKAFLAERRINMINSAVEAQGIVEYMTEENAFQLLNGADIAFDALDNMKSRKILFRICNELKKPVIHGAIAGFWGECSTFIHGSRNLFDILGDEVPEKGVETQTGNPPFTPAIIAAIQVSEGIKTLTQKGELLNGKLLWIDLKENEWMIVNC